MVPINTSTALTILCLDHNRIGATGMHAIAEALQINRTLAQLYVCDNDLGAEGAYYLAEALKVNRSVLNCYISGNNIGDEGAWYVAEALQVRSEQRIFPPPSMFFHSCHIVVCSIVFREVQHFT